MACQATRRRMRERVRANDACDNAKRRVYSLIKTGSYLDLEVARRDCGRGVLGIGSTTSPFLGPDSKVWRNMTLL